MTTTDLITALFYRVDEQLNAQDQNQRHSLAQLYPSEVVTLALLFPLKGVGSRAFDRWLRRDYQPLFPHLPERTRLFRLFNRYQPWTTAFLAQPSLLGVIDTYGIELIHPRREGRSAQQVGRKGLSNRRWIVGGKLCCLLNHLGLVVDWDCATANVHDGSTFQALVEEVAEEMVVFADDGFRKQDWLPANLRLCQPGEWNERMLIESVLAMLTTVCHFKKVMHRVWAYFQTRLAFTMALFNILVQWHGLAPDEDGFVALSIADFSL